MDKTCAEYQHNMFHDVGSGELLPTSILYSVASLGMIDSRILFKNISMLKRIIMRSYHCSWFCVMVIRHFIVPVYNITSQNRSIRSIQ